MPQDAMVIVHDSSMFVPGDYYATRTDIELYPDVDGEKQVMIGTNYMTMALGGAEWE